jgi:hypothetical protein
VLIQPIRNARRFLVPSLYRANKPLTSPSHDPRQFAESRHAMSATTETFTVQELPHLPRAIRLTGLLMQDAHPLDELLIGLYPCTG